MKKPGIAIMFGGLKKDEPVEHESDDGAEAAAEAFLEAVKSEDAKALASAFRSMMTCCSDEPDEDD